MNITPLTRLDQFQNCLELQREAFGAADIDLMPSRFLVVLTHIGGLVLGAYDGERLVAFLSAIPGIRSGQPYWHSQMLAVDRTYWNSGIGTQLKLTQRQQALDRGITLIEWTFDPLQSKNAYLNIEKLGVIIRRYYANHYGRTTSALSRGMDTDRVVAEWWLDRPRPAIAGDVRRVAIPKNVMALKEQDLDQARDIQRRVREQFLKNVADDFFVVALERKEHSSEYVFIKGASHVHS